MSNPIRPLRTPVRNSVAILAITATLGLSACGGGGDGSGTTAATPPATVATTLSLNAATTQTLAGGTAIVLSALVSDGTVPAWKLADGSPGSLSASSGASVNYVPPATVAANTAVTVTATAGSVSTSKILTVFPDPGAPGFYVISGRLNADILDAPADGPVADARFRNTQFVTSDLAGDLYVEATCQTPSRFDGLTLRKISNAGVVSTLASCDDSTWFGMPAVTQNLPFFSPPRGIAIDRAGNIYISNYLFAATAGNSVSGNSIYKITPQGGVTVLAGSSASQTAALVDGQGGTAQFLSPDLVGIDSDDNLYVLDNLATVVRKVTPAGAVNTITALPRSLEADLNGNTYRIDSTATMIIRTTPAGVDSTIANINTLPGIVAGTTPFAFALTRTGPASYALIVSNGYFFSNEVIAKLVVPH